MEELQSVGIGVALGLVLVSFLTFYPGEPFEYSTSNSGGTNNHVSFSKDAPSRSATSPEELSTDSNQQLDDHQKQIAAIEQAAQRVKIHKLQELLGLEKAKVQQLVDRAKEEAVEALAAGDRPSISSSSYSTWLDRAFFILMFGLLAWVLWADYNINILSVAAHLLPRESEVVRNVAAVPQILLADFIALWD
ncbi:hypothetical protein PHYBOEH_011766 [Phytophthora boehmeriae]|uniref:Uncharacterized protein n=1 Tax=Phytophthora boehmeriae TaxID=109152 RepID=A0A8T1WWQ1_9STRA|nr:hypothetical protein PHYBOEH_011766 [Phytophthora boehmeriae]